MLNSPHLRAVHDVAIAASGTLRLLVAVRAPISLDQLLASDGWLTPGRAVTSLVPIASLIREAHRAGVTLGSFSASDIGIDAAGTPVLDIRDSARVGAALPPELRQRDPAHRADVEAFVRLHAAVHAALTHSAHTELVALLPDAESVLDDPQRLMRWAHPVPLLESASAVTQIGSPGGASLGSPDSAAPLTPADDVVRGRLSRVLTAVALPASLRDRVNEGEEALLRLRSRLTTRARAASRAQLIAASAALAVVLAIVAGSVATVSAPTSSSASGGAGVGERALQADESTSGSQEASAESDPLAEAEPESWLTVAHELGRQWAQCHAEVRPLCEDALHAQGIASGRPLAEQDALLAALTDRLENPDVSAVVVERAGDVVLVELTAPDMTPASLLLVRSEAGWRVRDAWS